MANNPNPSLITPALWYFAEQCLAMQPGTQNGGIVATNQGGYHNTRNNLINQGRSNDYSIRQSPDKGGPGDKCAAFDWTFPDAQNGQYGTIIKYGARVRDTWSTRDPRAFGFREVLIQADWDNDAEGYDFYFGTIRTPDDSHLWHGHFSVLRAYLNDYAAMNGMLSILAGESLETWRAGRSRYGGNPGAAPGGTGDEEMFVAVLRGPNNAQRWVWSNGQTFTEIPGTTNGWLLAARRAVATGPDREHTNEADFLKEVGTPFAETLPNDVAEVELPADFEERVAARVITALGGALEDMINRTGLRVGPAD